MISRRNFITGLLAGASGLLGACAGWFGRKAAESMTASVLYGTYAQRIAYSASAGQWWFQTDDGYDDTTTYASGYYLYSNSTWGYFADISTIVPGPFTVDYGSVLAAIKARNFGNYTTGGAEALRLLHVTSQDMSDGFSISQVFGIQDSSGVENQIASIAAVRNGGDTTGDIKLQTSKSGTVSSRLVVDSDGKVTNYRADSNGLTLNCGGLFYSQATPATVANTTTQTTLYSASGLGSFTLNPYSFTTIGQGYRIRASGIMSTTLTPTLNITFRINGADVISTGAIATTGTISNHVWSAWVEAVLVTVGSSGTLRAQGEFNYDNSTHGSIRWGMASTATTSFNTISGGNTTDITATWGTASSSNTITCSNMTMEIFA